MENEGKEARVRHESHVSAASSKNIADSFPKEDTVRYAFCAIYSIYV